MNKSYTLAFLFLIFVLLIINVPGKSQGQQTEYSPEKIEAFKAEIKNLVDFLEYSFNTLGNPQTAARDKDVIINQSYAKVFLNAEVQIEDDLDDNRETLINKDVQAYLKDIDFFFREAVFSLNVSSIDHQVKSDGEIFFIVSLTRTLNARTVLGDSMSSNKERFIEINYDDLSQDLRIASIYTTKIDERDELFAWWNKLTGEWREILGAQATIKDTIPFSKVVEINDTIALIEYYGMMEIAVDTFLVYDTDTLFVNETDTVEGFIRDTVRPMKNYNYRMLQRIAAEPEIDVSGNLHIMNLEPLSQMGNITDVNCANTLISDLSPLRSLIKIESLNCSGTSVTDLSPMQYSISLKSMDVSATRISDIKALSNLRNLEKLDLSNTLVDSLEMLASLKNLSDLRIINTPVAEVNVLSGLEKIRILNLSGTNVNDIKPLGSLPQLERLYISNTRVDDLTPLKGLAKLQTIYLDSTKVKNIKPLEGLPGLENVYCDNTGVTGTQANEFMEKNPDVLVIYESVALARWWDSMSTEWKDIFRNIAALDAKPGKEELHQAVKIDEIIITGNDKITTLEPLKQLVQLKKLQCGSTGIKDLSPLSDHIDLQYLDCSGTMIKSCDALRDLLSLEYLDISNTEITEITCLKRLKNLKELNIEGTQVATINVFQQSNLHLVRADNSKMGLAELIKFRQDNPDCIVIYQTAVLEDWYSKLNAAWRGVFTKAIGIKNHPGPVELQQMADLLAVDLGQSVALGNLDPLKKLYRLKELRMNDTQIADLSPIANMHSLEVLVISNNPIDDLEQISGLSQLKQLEFKNTPVDDLEALTGLIKLEVLDMAGTQIKKLDDLQTLTRLRQLSFYNTSIKSLSPLETISSLESVKCYNTKLNDKRVRKFKELRPDCEVIFY